MHMVHTYNKRKIQSLQQKEAQLIDKMSNKDPVEIKQLYDTFNKEVRALSSYLERKKNRKFDKIAQAQNDRNNKNDEKYENMTQKHLNTLRQRLSLQSDEQFEVENKTPIPIVTTDKEAQWSRHPVKADGNCFWRAVSYQLFHTETQNATIRTSVVSHMKDNKSKYERYIDENFESHMEKMENSIGGSEIWATEAEIKATAHYLGINISVNQITGDSEVWQNFECSQTTDIDIHLYHCHQHFEPMIHTQKSSDCRSQEKQRKNNLKKMRQMDRAKQSKCKRYAKTDNNTRPAMDDNQRRNTDNTENHSKKQNTTKENKDTQTTVFNRSSKILTQDEEDLLSKGLKFVPTRKKVNISKMLADLREWERRMRLREFFFDNQDNNHDDGQLDRGNIQSKIYHEEEARQRNKIWMPPSKRDPALDLYIELVKDDILDGLHNVKEGNLSKGEEIAMKSLMNDDSIIIRPADKGSGIVIMDTEEYVRRVEQDLEKNDTYIQIDKDPTDSVSTKVRKIVKGLHRQGAINEKQMKYMTPSFSKGGIVKGNPKVHKQEMPMRTIVSTINHPTEKIAEVAEQELNEWVSKLPSYIKDTTDFLKKFEDIKDTIPPGSIMFTMDVKALYPSIPRTETTESCRKALDSRKEKTIPTDTVITLISTVLDNSTFTFNNKHYKQTDGTSIGSKLGKNLACTYMGMWEHELLDRCKDSPPLIYFRYIDDIFGIWTGSEEGLNQFHNTANNIHKRIKLEMSTSKQTINFLDVKVYLKEDKYETTIYSKPTDKHLYLHKKSDHPTTTKKAIPYGLGIRAKRICSSNKQYQANRSTIANNLTKRGYKFSEMDKVLGKVDVMERKNLLSYRKNDTSSGNNRVPLVLTYNRGLPKVQEIVHRHMKVLHRSQKMKEVFDDPPITAFRRDTNLEDIIVHAKGRKMFEKGLPGTNKCGKKCIICNYLKVGTSHISNDGKTYYFNDRFNCKTNNCIYGIFCKVCKEIVYVGETGTTIYERFQNHLTSIRKKKIEPVPTHFNGAKHSIDDMQILGIETIRRKDIHYRKIRESFWIKKLDTIQPKGLNQNNGVGA